MAQYQEEHQVLCSLQVHGAQELFEGRAVLHPFFHSSEELREVAGLQGPGSVVMKRHGEVGQGETRPAHPILGAR